VRIAISDSNPGSKIDVEGLRTSAERCLAALDLAESELSIALVDDEEIKELNGQWRQKPTATDVLSFSLVEGEFADHRAGLLGDVVISVETAAREASERHRSLEEVVTRLMIHGVLHLIGHDHEADDEAKRMRAEELRLWRATRS
jgi:probable rRNA maturation factor